MSWGKLTKSIEFVSMVNELIVNLPFIDINNTAGEVTEHKD
jgi:hypothetical protein